MICIFDYHLVLTLFKAFTDWVKLHPYQSVGYSVYLIAFSVIFTIPISYTIVMLGYTYTQVFESKLHGFLFSVPIVFSGTVIGGLLAFMLSRYLFKDFIKDQIASSEWLSHNFNIIDEILQTEGKLIVALIRLTFAPFGITSYIMGVSSISFFDFAIGHISYIFMSSSLCFIGCLMYSAVSHEANVALNQENEEKSKHLARITFIVEIIFTIIVTFIIGYVSKNILEKKLRE